MLGAHVRAALTSALLALCLSTGWAYADVIVIGSSEAAWTPGTVLKDNGVIEVAKGGRVRVMLASGRTQEIKGPAKVAVASLGSGEKVNESLWNDVKKLVAAQRKADESVIGAVRSMAPKNDGAVAAADAGAKGAPLFSWRRVPIDKGGDVCIEKGADLEIARAKGGPPLAVTIVDMHARKRAEVDFPVGAVAASWPRELRSDVGIYMVVMPEGELREIRLRPIAPLPTADDTLRVLYGQRCLEQVSTWLSSQMIPSP